jgi:CRP-like cAMP-binding protein
VLFLPEDYIVKEGEKGDNIYFIHKGEVSVSMLQAIVNDKSKSDKSMGAS